MKNHLLFWALAGVITACQQEAEIQPGTSSLAGEVVGTYRTNVYLDPANVAISISQMPYAELKAETDSSVTMVYTKLYPAKTSQLIEHVSLVRRANGIQLRLADSSIGMLQTDRIFTNNGMEKQGKLLRIGGQTGSSNGVSFTGFR
ncbi:hypothetical protein [Spirosoma koreense]